MDPARRIEMLEKLANLYRSGDLSEAEYAAEKAKLLAATASPVASVGPDEGDGFVLASNEEAVDRFRGSTTGWVLGSLAGWGSALLCLAAPVALLASVTKAPLIVAIIASLAGVGIIVWRYLRNISARYELTTQRLILRSGILFKRVDEIELFRVKDARVNFSLVNQITGIGRITLRTSDQSSHQVDFVMRDIPDAQEIRETIRMLVDHARQRRRVRELDIDEWNS